MLRQDVNDAALKAAFEMPLTPEQRHRLVRIALHKYYAQLNSDPAPDSNAAPGPGGLGIATGSPDSHIVTPGEHPGLTVPAFLVTETIPGFPAFTRLRPGDLILAIGEKTLSRENPEFSGLLGGKNSGEEVVLRILRGDREVSITLQLASLDRLKKTYNGAQPREGWRKWAMSAPDFRAYLRSLGPQERLAARIEVKSPPAERRLQRAAEETGVSTGDAI